MSNARGIVLSIYPTAILKDREDRRLLAGHRWAYRNEFAQLPRVEDGTTVDVQSFQGRHVGRGFYQGEGGIAIRIIDREPIPIDGAFWRQRLDAARAFREKVFGGSDAYRWIFGESDGLPGLVVDRYGPFAVAQTSCGFYNWHREALVAALLETPGIETLSLTINGEQQVYGREVEAVDFTVEGFRLSLPLAGTQKTGLFLDQRMNRLAIEPWCRGARVMDGHCYHGLWSLHAARAGAGSVHAFDTSADAIARAQHNAEVNGVAGRCHFEARSVESALEDDVQYDVVIIDPPAFAKARAQASNAMKRYRQLNTAAIQRTAPGGILVSCSCSHFVSPQDFLGVIQQAAALARRDVWLLEMRGAAPDHPVLMAMPETEYLKCAVLRVS
jgi:23S rRNA (cytosine1962-C5)-methyltransferase